MVSIKDIAKVAGVTHSTVSRALRDSPGVSAEKRAEIKRIAAEMGYRPSAVARSLVRQRTRAVGVVVTRLSNPFYGVMVESIEAEAKRHNYNVLLGLSSKNAVKEKAVVEMMAQYQVEGIIVAASGLGDHYLTLLDALKMPIVLINSHHTSDNIYSITIDNQQGGYIATQHLTRHGHRRIACIDHERGGYANRQRVAGYRQALAEAGLPCDQKLIVSSNGRVSGGVQAMQQLLRREPRPTAVFCYNDLTAIGALKAIVQAGLAVPDDISLVGFDGLDEAGYVVPPLTTVEQPRRHMGKLAMEMLLGLLNNESQPTKITLPGKLVLGASVAHNRLQ